MRPARGLEAVLPHQVADPLAIVANAAMAQASVKLPIAPPEKGGNPLGRCRWPEADPQEDRPQLVIRPVPGEGRQEDAPDPGPYWIRTGWECSGRGRPSRCPDLGLVGGRGFA